MFYIYLDTSFLSNLAKVVREVPGVSFTTNSMDAEKQDGHLLATCTQPVSSSASHCPSDSSMKLHLM